MSMTESEAIEYLSNRYLVVGSPVNPPKEECEKHNAIMDMAITALSEVQQYRAIGSVEELREKMNFLEYLYNHIQPNEMEQYLAMYHALEEKGE